MPKTTLTSKNNPVLQNIIQKTRQYFLDLDFEEVPVPLLNSSLPLEQNIYSFEVSTPGSQDKYYLPTSPESALKKYLALHHHNCFSISPCFRNLESTGPHHRPEFTMLEWYEVNKNYQDIITSVKKYIDIFSKFEYSEFQIPSNSYDNEPDFNQYFLNEIESKLPPNGVFVTNYPPFLTPLALPYERFELYLKGVEIANGNSENADPTSVLKAFKNEESHRLANHLPTHPIDLEFVEALGNLPKSAGVGIGLDRLAMILTNSTTIL